MSESETVYSYLRDHSMEIGQRILEQFPPLHAIGDPISPLVRTLLRKPFAAQAAVLMGLARAWQNGARHSIVLGEMGTGKTLMSLGAIHVHSEGRPYTAIAMVPPHIVNKWAREAIRTIPRLRVFFIDGFRDSVSKSPNGIHEVKLRHGRIVRDGLSTTLSDLRLRRNSKSAQARWLDRVRQPSLFIVGKETAKLGPAWRHAYRIARSGSNRGRLINCETGQPLENSDGERLTEDDFKDFKRSQIIRTCGEAAARTKHSALWQVDPDNKRRTAPIDFIGRYMDGFFDYSLCDELHQLAHLTAQGNALGVLASCTKWLLGLTGTLVDGYAGHLFNILFRLYPHQMREAGYEYDAAGRADFIEEYGILEEIQITEPKDNATSEARTTERTRERPGASPRVFGNLLMEHCAFIFLKDIAAHLPSYTESLVPITMDASLQKAYEGLQSEAKLLLKAHRGNRSVMSKLMHALLLYPNHPFGHGQLYAIGWDKTQKRRVRFLLLEPPDLPRNVLYPKENDLIHDIRKELAEGRRCQVFSVYTKTQERVTRLLESAGFRVAHLTVKVPSREREAWYSKQTALGIQVIVAHPQLIQTGLDIFDFPTFYFYETGHSVHVMRQASRRSYRIGQRLPVRVKFLIYLLTTQDTCLSHMLRKKLIALTTEGQYCGEGIEQDDDESDILAAVARSLMKEDIGETAEQVWSTLRETEEALEAAGLVGSIPNTAEALAREADFEDETDSTPPWPVPDIPADPSLSSLLICGQRRDDAAQSRRRTRLDNPDQPWLF